MTNAEPPRSAPTVHTVGHGTRTPDEIVALLKPVGVETVVDVRRFPGSRRNPHLAREALARSLPERGVAYEWQGEALGGRRSRVAGSRHVAWRNASFQGYADHMETDAFRAALREIAVRSRAGERLAVMCAETLWWRCHRRLIADALVAAGVAVVHLIDEDSTHEHELHEAARVSEDGSIVYDVGIDRELL